MDKNDSANYDFLIPKDDWFELTPAEKLRFAQNELGMKLSKELGINLSGVIFVKRNGDAK